VLFLEFLKNTSLSHVNEIYISVLSVTHLKRWIKSKQRGKTFNGFTRIAFGSANIGNVRCSLRDSRLGHPRGILLGKSLELQTVKR
jgi:hypothetical protein